IWARTVEDALYAQGFLHARDRLWQMDLVRRAVQGRLAEVMGESALSTDRFIRRLGLWDAARASEALLNERERAYLAAYADGVNAALRTWSGALPPEFLVLGYEPEPWEPAHTLAVAKMMSLTLAQYHESVNVARALRRLPEERVQWLFPAVPEWGATILSNEIPEPPVTPALAATLIDRYSVAAASNSWVIDGSMTVSGRPILANDMHLELQAPSLWYLVALHAPASAAAPALDVVGVSIPGAPFIITGRNRAIAWGMTNAYVDDVDIFLERPDPADPTRYLTPDGSRRFEVVQETIQVKGWDAPEVMEVRRTRHGPVLPSEGAPERDTLGTVLSVRWTAFEPTTVFRGVIGFNLARSWTEFEAAIDQMDDPHQNLVYGDTAGHIGYVMGGTVPLRGERRPAPVAPRPGWTGEWDWQGALPFAEHPRAVDPEAGYIVTANNRQVAGPMADLISQVWNEPFRAMRIAQMIEDGSRPYDTDAVLAMQMDVLDLRAERYVDRAVEAADAAGLTDVADALRAWDHRASGDSRAAPVFYAWVEIVRRSLARHLYEGAAPAYFPRSTASAVLERSAVPWADEPGDAYRRLAEEAMEGAAAVAWGRRWDESNRAVHAHALAEVEALDRLLGLNIGPAPHYGSPSTVNVAHWAFWSPTDDFPFTTTAGPSMRQVIDLGNTDGAGGFVIPTGQSGLPFSAHYANQTPLWRDGGLLVLPLERAAVEGLAEQRLTLQPEAGG
ncbi:MAG: penicillin acylase family protein, partial [Gemmatimonadota bacterium]